MQCAPVPLPSVLALADNRLSTSVTRIAAGSLGPSPPPSELEPFGEDDFSLFAVCRASAALAAAAVLGPGDVEAVALVEPTETGTLISSWHGVTFFASMKRPNAPVGTCTREPIQTCSSWRVLMR